MAKQPKPEKPAARKPGVAAIRLDLSAADRDDFRVMAAEAGVPMSQLAKQIVEEQLAKWRARRQGR